MFSAPPSSYRQVDKTGAEYKEALAREKERQLASGKDASDAEKEADKKATRQLIKAEKERRTDLVAPLIKSIQQIESRTGCWAMIVTTKRKKEGSESVVIERYDPFQPAEKCWTLVSFNGFAPDEKTQAAYRAKKAKTRTKRHEEKPLGERISRNALRAEFSCTKSDLTGENTFVFDQGPIDIAGFGHCPRTVEIFKIDSQNQRLISLQRQFLGPLSVLGMHTDEFNETKEFAVVDKDYPPFLIRRTNRYHTKVLGRDSGLVEEEILYTDYRKVKCYDERFEAKAGELRIMETIPSVPDL